VIVRIFKKLAEARNNYICVIKVVLNLLRLNSRIKEGGQEIDVIAFYNIDIILKLINTSFNGGCDRGSRIVLTVLKLLLVRTRV